MWWGDEKVIPGCTCRFIKGYDSFHTYDCGLVAKVRQDKEDRRALISVIAVRFSEVK